MIAGIVMVIVRVSVDYEGIFFNFLPAVGAVVVVILFDLFDKS